MHSAALPSTDYNRSPVATICRSLKADRSANCSPQFRRAGQLALADQVHGGNATLVLRINQSSITTQTYRSVTHRHHAVRQADHERCRTFCPNSGESRQSCGARNGTVIADYSGKRFSRPVARGAQAHGTLPQNRIWIAPPVAHATSRQTIQSGQKDAPLHDASRPLRHFASHSEHR